MKKILSTTAIAGSLCLLGTSAFAQFSGPYGAASFSAAAVTTEASKTGGTASTDSIGGTKNTNTGTGNAGQAFPLAALDLGYSFAAAKGTSIAIGATYTPLKGKIEGKSNDTNSGGVQNVEVKDMYSVYIKPSFEINKDAAVLLGVHYTKADVSATNVTSAVPDLEGFGISGGLRVMLTKDAFIQTEAVYTKFDSISVTDTSTLKTGATRTITANDPTLIEGRITLGFKF